MMITKQDLEDYRFRKIALEQQFAKLKMWKDKLMRLHITYGSGRVAEKLGYVLGQSPSKSCGFSDKMFFIGSQAIESIRVLSP